MPGGETGAGERGGTGGAGAGTDATVHGPEAPSGSNEPGDDSDIALQHMFALLEQVRRLIRGSPSGAMHTLNGASRTPGPKWAMGEVTGDLVELGTAETAEICMSKVFMVNQ